jgi:hypothetical protein
LSVKSIVETQNTCWLPWLFSKIYNLPSLIKLNTPDTFCYYTNGRKVWKFLQVFFCSDEVWNIKKSEVVLAGMVVA